MPELRLDPVTNKWVVLAEGRARRPKDHVEIGHIQRDKPARDEKCPFCPGNEGATPPEVFAFRPEGSDANRPGWRVRGVPNMYPALTWGACAEPTTSGLFTWRPATGVHEVIIETPLHNSDIPLMQREEMADVVRAYRQRHVALSSLAGMRYVLVFRNHGKEAGASLDHPHSQVAAVPIVPPVVLEEVDGAGRYYGATRRCVFCDMVNQELEAGARIVLDSPRFVALEPYASRVPYETWIIPRAHVPSFAEIDDRTCEDLAATISETLSALSAGLDDPPYNWVIHSAPIGEACDRFYHWHLEIFPKLTVAAGFEVGMGLYINVVAPEAAAGLLRKYVQGGLAKEGIPRCGA